MRSAALPSGLAAGGVPGAASVDEVLVRASWSDSDADGVASELKGVGPLPWASVACRSGTCGRAGSRGGAPTGPAAAVLRPLSRGPRPGEHSLGGERASLCGLPAVPLRTTVARRSQAKAQGAVISLVSGSEIVVGCAHGSCSSSNPSECSGEGGAPPVGGGGVRSHFRVNLRRSR